VLDNASKESEVSELRESFPGVRVIRQGQRRGFGANQNRAVQAARGKLVLILNPDTEISPGTLDKLVGALNRDPRAAIAAGPIHDSSGRIWADQPLPYPSPISVWTRATGIDRLIVHVFGRRRRGAGWVSGCALLVDRELFLEVGGFDEDFFMFSEDTDLAYRFEQHERGVSWVSDAPVMHVGATSVEEVSDRRIVEYVRSQARYMRKHYGYFGELIFRGGASLGSLIRLAALRLPFAELRVDRKGPSISTTHTYHARTLRALARPHSSQGLREDADEWNRSARVPS
jgi:GT2 family glycosyltransferase